MTEFFLTIVNMSISASWIVLVVLLLRLLVKKAPKWITVLLWGIVAVRLVCPFSIESAISLIPSSQTINPETALYPPAIDSGVSIIDNAINPIIGEATITLQPEKDLNFFQYIMPYLAGLWLVGIAVLLIYTVVSYVQVKRKIGTSVLLRDNIFQSESVVSPFVLGIITPKIYLPFKMNEQDMEHVIAHEQAHLRRKDHWWKPLGFLILTIHWFNPLMWLGYMLLCRDIELACDEKVIKALNTEQKADYSQALLACSVNRRMIAACPIAFGEIGVKDRVKSILNYKKPAFLIIVVAIIASIVVAVCFLTNPINTSDKVLNKLINLEEYEVIEQDQKSITLTIPIADLTDSIYTESGKKFGDKEIIAYQDATTSIYLKEARYSNEGKDNLYFCFDFAFDLPKKQGSLLYPYEITNSGLTGSVRTVDGILKADNGEFMDAVNDRGQGSYNLIWFYISTDALMQAHGTIRFDALLNKITYFLDGDEYNSVSNVGGVDSPTNIIIDGDEYNSVSNVGGVDSPTNIITSADIEQLKTKYPMYFDLSTSKGLEVYIWQMAEGTFSCGLLSGKNRNYTQEELWDLHKSPASVDEMRIIVASYIPDITQSEVVICPIQMPHSSYAYNIDEAYREKITNLFWNDFPIIEVTSYRTVIDTATFDIDGDGKDEQCALSYGPTSGLFTFVFSASENGKLEYFNIFNSPYLELSFEKNAEGKTILVGKSVEQTRYMGMDVDSGNIVISSDEQDISYWGEQGINSPYAPKATAN